mmetsp:Transcript_20238/g.47574  ORF Transcript_20238/g.47574 Transcript_20238/m.47574 type:complete len:98 (+) Transcript_20238:2499-2792(+)
MKTTIAARGAAFEQNLTHAGMTAGDTISVTCQVRGSPDFYFVNNENLRLVAESAVERDNWFAVFEKGTGRSKNRRRSTFSLSTFDYKATRSFAGLFG